MSRQKKWIIIGIGSVAAVCGLLILTYWLDSRSKKEILKLADYRTIDCGGANPADLSDQIVEALVTNTKFGKALEKRTERIYGDTMGYIRREADYLSLSLNEYAAKFYNGTEKELRATVWETSEGIAKEEAVLDAIADKEEVVLTDEQFEKLLPKYMESNGYTDRLKFLIDNNEAEVRASMRRELTLQLVIDYLTEANSH